MKKSHFITLVVLTLVLLVAGTITFIVYKTPNDAPDSKASESLKATETNVYTDLNGNPFSFEDYEGTVRVVNVWASWVPFSTQELKDLETLALEYSSQSVAVIAINRKEPKEQAKRFLDSLQTFSSIHFAIDLSDAFYTSIGGYAMPETIFYDKHGDIVFHKRGDMGYEEMREHVEAALLVR